MSIQKHEIPILEFDSDPSAVLEPGHEALDVHFPERAVFAFLQDTIEKYLSDYNTDFYYQSREYIALCYREGEIVE